MNGIDVSNWQFGLIPSEMEIDFCICKATEGVGYIDPCCDSFVQNCIDNNVLWGFYHFARENEPESEAEFFYENCSNYFKHGIPVLDYETSNYNDVEWCERFIQRLHDLSGVWCIIYLSASRIPAYWGSWIPDKCGLWVAGYPYTQTDWTYDVMPYDIEPWSFAAIWQFTSSLILPGYVGKLDGNVAYMDREAWMKYAQSTSNPPIEENLNTHGKTIDDLVLEVLQGKHGADEQRRESLGSRYDEVQTRINHLYEIADEVIEGKWGNDWNREQSLNSAGYPYDIVQGIVNEKLA